MVLINFDDPSNQTLANKRSCQYKFVSFNSAVLTITDKHFFHTVSPFICKHGVVQKNIHKLIFNLNIGHSTSLSIMLFPEQITQFLLKRLIKINVKCQQKSIHIISFPKYCLNISRGAINQHSDFIKLNQITIMLTNREIILSLLRL